MGYHGTKQFWQGQGCSNQLGGTNVVDRLGSCCGRAVIQLVYPPSEGGGEWGGLWEVVRSQLREERSDFPSRPAVWTIRLATSASGDSRAGSGGAHSRPQTPDPRPAQIPSLTCRGPAPPLPFPLQHFLFPALFHLFTCSALLTVYFHSWTEHSLRAEKVLSYWPCIHQGRAEPVFPVA